MTLSSSENVLVSNPFGTVTDRRVTYFAEKSWFGGGHREDIPIGQIASVQQTVDRRLFLGLFLLLIGLNGLRYFFGIIPLAFGVLLLWGSPKVIVVSTGGTRSSVIGLPWQRSEGNAFANALREQLFKY